MLFRVRVVFLVFVYLLIDFIVLVGVCVCVRCVLYFVNNMIVVCVFD